MNLKGDPILGIDLGTTNSVVAIFEGDEPSVIPNAEGQLKTPSVVCYEDNGTVLVGDIARRQAATKPERTVTSAKRLIGHYFAELEEGSTNLPFKIEPDENDEVLIVVGDRRLKPEEVQAEVLKKLKADAEAYLGHPVSQAIITVPAYFDDRQRSATKQAGQLAGLEVLRLVNEPTAAAMAYGLGKGTGGVTAIYDFGGGTFDLTVLDISERTFEVQMTDGDSQLGGDDLDRALVQLLVDEFFKEYNVDLTHTPETLLRLKEEAERVKIELSSVRQAHISLPFLTQIDGEPVHYERAITRTELEQLVEPLVQRSIDICERALKAKRMKVADVARVILVGGTTRMPLVAQMVEEFFERPPFKGVNPDEIVALGAAVQGGVLAGNLDEVVLLDVTPHSLGLETRDDGYSVIVERNTTIPIKKAKTFTTTEANQEFVNVHVLQGEGTQASANLSLGKFMLKGIEPAPPGHPRIRVTFQINADGILEIVAQDMASGAARNLTIAHAYLSEDERKTRMAANARKAKADRQSRRDRPVAPTRPRAGTSSSSSGADSQRRNTVGVRSPGAPGGASPPSRGVAPVAAAEAPPPPPRSITSSTFALIEDTGGDSEAQPRPAGGIRTGFVRSPSAEQLLQPPTDTVERGVPLTETASPTRPDLKAIPTAAPAPTAKAPAAPIPAAPPRPIPPAVEAYNPAAATAPYTPRPTPAVVPPAVEAEQPGMWSPRELVEDLKRESTSRGRGHAAPPAAPAPAPPSAAPAPSAADVKLCPEGELGDSLRLAFNLINAGKDDQNAIAAYQEVFPRLEQLCEIYPQDPELHRYAATIALLRGVPEQALAHTVKLVESPAGQPGEAIKLFNRLLERYPNFGEARRQRAALYEGQGKYEGAIKDIEFILNLESNDQELVRRLEHVYERLLEARYSGAAELKLIKVLLRQNKLDDAIRRLQNVVEDPQYRERAQKVLGFCYWQKQMYYPAFQQFKNLPISEEIKDVLFRLASDLDSSGDPQHALEVMEFLAGKDSNYLDVQVRLAGLKQRQRPANAVGTEQAADQRRDQGPGNPLQALRGSRFVILEELNRGSMGVVFKARDTTLDEIVALKVLNDFLCADPMAIERFKREARAAKKLTHHRIVRINDLYEIGDKKLISMEYIDGRDLKRIMMEMKRIPKDMLKNYVLQICDGLDYAHKRGVIHRDVKPANIMITSDSHEVKITDFGIAKNLQSDDMTTGSRILGTPLYMAPEQIEGKAVDARSDIYALGIMMYEMVSGTPPFCEGNIEYQHIHMDPPPLPTTVDQGLAAVIYKSVRKKKDDRFKNVAEMIEALRVV